MQIIEVDKVTACNFERCERIKGAIAEYLRVHETVDPWQIKELSGKQKYNYRKARKRGVTQ